MSTTGNSDMTHRTARETIGGGELAERIAEVLMSHPLVDAPKDMAGHFRALADSVIAVLPTPTHRTAGENAVDQIAECIWQAEWKRSGNGGLRKVPWSEIAEKDQDRYRFLAREVTALASPPVEPVQGVTEAGERLHGWLAGTFAYKAYRGRAPDGVPQLRSDVRLVMDAALAAAPEGSKDG